MKGRFRVWLPRTSGILVPPEPDIIVPNLITDEGEEEFLKMIFQNVTAIAGGANWYIGLCDQSPSETNELADIITEPSGAGGYARQAVPRSAVGWPTITTINDHIVIRTTTETFAASGADFSAEYTRLFLTDQASGTSGVLYSISAALPSGVLVTNGTNAQVQYEIGLN